MENKSDDKCFMRLILRYIHQCEDSHLKQYENNLNFKKMEFPVCSIRVDFSVA